MAQSVGGDGGQSVGRSRAGKIWRRRVGGDFSNAAAAFTARSIVEHLRVLRCSLDLDGAPVLHRCPPSFR